MARRSSVDEPSAPSNCSDETKRQAYREALILKIAAEGAAEAAKSKLGSYRAYLKVAGKRGVSTQAIINALAHRFEDPDLVLIEERERLRLYELSGFLPGIRDKLLSRLDVQEPTTREEEENQVLIAFDRGALAGRSGHPQTVNDYPVGSPGYVKWIEGWRAGQQAIADEMVMEQESPRTVERVASPPPPPPPRGTAAKGRGRPRKAAKSNAQPSRGEAALLAHDSNELPGAIPPAVF
jgi:hypothetical protein